MEWLDDLGLLPHLSPEEERERFLRGRKKHVFIKIIWFGSSCQGFCPDDIRRRG
jgi:hypothetical protein